MSGQPPFEKTCIQCGKTLPASTKYFHKSKDGYHARCRLCRNKREQENRKKKRNKKLDQIERGAVDLFVSAARIGGANIPHSAELLECIMEYCGGVRGFANLFMKQYYDSPVGGAFRTKMLDGVQKLVQSNTAVGGAKKPLELMSEAELEAELRRQVLEAAMTLRKVEVVDEVRNLPVVGEVGADQGLGAVSEIPAPSPAHGVNSGPDDPGREPLRGME